MSRFSFRARMVAQLAVIASGCALTLPAQDLVPRINAVRDGLLRFSYASRADVCGDGETMIGWHNTQMQFFGNWTNFSDGRHWRERCVHGPLHVTLKRAEGRTVNLKVMAGPSIRDSVTVTDLGMVPAAVAVKTLIGLARSDDLRAGDHAILAAALADSAVVWPELVTLARDSSRSKRVRVESRQWLAWLAGDHVLGPPPEDEGKKGLRGDEKAQAVFVLSEMPRGEGIPDLIRIARSHKDPHVRRSALFWLGQKNDPRSVDLFEELLRGP